MDRFLRREEVENITSMKDPTMWREERAGRFPKRRKLTARIVGWPESEISQWLETRLDNSNSSTDAVESD